MLAGVDLDRTLIYSRGALRTYGHDDGVLVPVERHEGADSSWMTARAADHLLAAVAAGVLLVPSTTRTVKQLKRVRLPGPEPRFAIAANGGVLLIDGRPDPHWTAAIGDALARVATLAEVHAHAEGICRPEWTKSLRIAEGMFCYAVLHRRRVPPGLVEETAEWARARGWQVSFQGRKLYWVPATLSKGAALAEVARRTDARAVLAAGDSLLDADLLLEADQAILARHGELAASGWSAPHVTVTESCGVLAGEQILAWIRARVTSGAEGLSRPGDG